MATTRPPFPPQYIPGFHRPSCRTHTPAITASKRGTHSPTPPPPPFNIRLKNAVRLQVRQRFTAVFASSNGPTGGDTLREKSEATKTSDDTPRGPPLLTILAGFLVFLVICWILGSIVVWLIGLIVHPPPSK